MEADTENGSNGHGVLYHGAGEENRRQRTSVARPRNPTRYPMPTAITLRLCCPVMRPVAFLRRLPLRLLAFNVLLVVLPASGVHYLGIFERTLLDAQERAMVQQGRLLAAMLAARPDVATDDVERILASLDRRTTARLRVLNADGWLVADSSRTAAPTTPRGISTEERPAPRDPRESRLYRFGASIGKLILGPRPSLEAAEERFDSSQPYRGVEIDEALAGRYGATYRITPGQRSVTLYSALPIVVEDGRVAGVVLVSQTTLRILQDLYEVRLALLRVVVLALVLAALISAIVALTVARPLARLSSQSLALLDARGRLRGQLEPSSRRDEIGDLERALAELSRRLGERERFVASFVADLAHELKNPLASIRAATEVGADVDDPGERRRLQATVEREVARLEVLLDELREVTRFDDEASKESLVDVDLAQVLQQVVAARRVRHPGVQFDLVVDAAPVIPGLPDSLARAFDNLIDNAVSFSPVGGTVSIRVEAKQRGARVVVEDQGPGILDAHLDHLFERFFSYRPSGARGQDGHVGLGLAIVRRTIERHGGRISAENRAEGGARFVVEL